MGTRTRAGPSGSSHPCWKPSDPSPRTRARTSLQDKTRQGLVLIGRGRQYPVRDGSDYSSQPPRSANLNSEVAPPG